MSQNVGLSPATTFDEVENLKVPIPKLPFFAIKHVKISSEDYGQNAEVPHVLHQDLLLSVSLCRFFLILDIHTIAKSINHINSINKHMYQPCMCRLIHCFGHFGVKIPLAMIAIPPLFWIFLDLIILNLKTKSQEQNKGHGLGWQPLQLCMARMDQKLQGQHGHKHKLYGYLF